MTEQQFDPYLRPPYSGRVDVPEINSANIMGFDIRQEDEAYWRLRVIAGEAQATRTFIDNEVVAKAIKLYDKSGKTSRFTCSSAKPGIWSDRHGIVDPDLNVRLNAIMDVVDTMTWAQARDHLERHACILRRWTNDLHRFQKFAAFNFTIATTIAFISYLFDRDVTFWLGCGGMTLFLVLPISPLISNRAWERAVTSDQDDKPSILHPSTQ